MSSIKIQNPQLMDSHITSTGP